MPARPQDNAGDLRPANPQTAPMSDGWQAGLMNPDGTPAIDTQQADAICTSIGWSVSWEEDAPNGIWGVAIPEQDLIDLMSTGFIERTSPTGRGQIEADLDQIGEDQ